MRNNAITNTEERRGEGGIRYNDSEGPLIDGIGDR